ncbi:hypothetical protein E2562_037741 [Oryza meyeriana var. granulata]|uniref:No apical meristem-associated C-terminal domain-containing protein n=1 Tax=Oryza meyeriana var. granulata TaxID=110450 RepID=A0A6G1C293_9ORYZ|nr:hypothetical protein E2562_037741 [Oryza meyeriana var. granulata]
MSCPPMNGQPSQGFSIDNNHGSEDPPSLKSQRAEKKKKVSRRGTAFTKEEDMVTSGGYYKRMHDYFNERKPEGSNRSQIAIQHRWALIQKAMNKFCGHKASVDRLNESGKNKQDRIDDAVEMYEKTKPFTFMHCWKLLRNEAKWNSRFLELNNSTSPDQMSPPSTQGHTVAGHAESRYENVDIAWPEGRDSAKRRRSKSFAETSSSSTAVEVLQRLHEKSEKTELKQDQQMKKHMKMSVKQHKKENEIREKQMEAQLMSVESSIMSIDIEKVPPYLKNYYLGMQRQIMERRGFSSPSNNED